MSNQEKTGTSFGTKVKALAVILAILMVAGGGLFRLAFVTFVDQHMLPYKYDRITGQVSRLPRTGYIVHAPFVTEVFGIDLRPRQVLLTVGQPGTSKSGASSRVLNAKLVQFNEAGLDAFIKLHGLQDGDVSEILKIYAFDPQHASYPFLRVEAETSSQSSQGK